MNAINETVKHLADMYAFFNDKLDAKLPIDIVISLIPNKTARSQYYGWFAHNRWLYNNNKIHEINIAADYLNRTISDIAETMLHEITHLTNHIKGIRDCSPNQYHNKAFKTQAELFGLKVQKARNKGYALTSLDEKGKIIVEEYKSKILKGRNPFMVHRISDTRSSYTSNKK